MLGLENLRLNNLDDSMASQFKESATRNIEERSEAIYKLVLELCEKASKDGAFELYIKPCDDTIALFKHATIRGNVFKKLREEGFKVKIEKKYILVKW